MKKMQKKKVVTHGPIALSPTGGAQPVPEVAAPKAPQGFTPPPKGSRRSRRRAAAVQRLVAKAAAAEIRANASLFAEVVPVRIATADGFASALELGDQWQQQDAAATAWSVYTNEQASLAWQGIMGVVEALRDPFASASGSDSAIGEAFPSLTKLLDGHSDAARRGAATRKQDKKKQGSTATAAAGSGTSPGAVTTVPVATPVATPQMLIKPSG